MSDLISGVAERRDSASAIRGDAFTRVPALDGIRAVAIVAVLLYHHYQFDVPGSHAWAGGFLGVDIFFVLSGFLITTLLLHEHASAGRIDFARFWSRRARRLLPAMFALIVVTALLGRYAFSAATAAGVRGEGFATLLYVENWNRLGGASSALSHTWSLSVEEQWYLVWPLLLAALVMWSRRRSRSLAWPVALLIVASAAECAVLFHGIGERSYYGTDTRAQSLLVGALLAVLLIRRPQGRSRVIEAAGWVAVGFLALMIWRLHSVDPWLYRGGFLLVAATAALLIAAVQHSGAGPLGRLFGSRPLVAIGLISYGLYLYHYPIYLWLTASRTHLTALPLLIARLVVTGLVAVASYFLIERPFRRGQFSGKRALALVGCGGIALGAVALPAPPAPSWAVAEASRYVEAAANIPGGDSRVLVAGDATAVSLTLQRWFFRGDSIGGVASGLYGSGNRVRQTDSDAASLRATRPLLPSGDAGVPAEVQRARHRSRERARSSRRSEDISYAVAGTANAHRRTARSDAFRADRDACAILFVTYSMQPLRRRFGCAARVAPERSSGLGTRPSRSHVPRRRSSRAMCEQQRRDQSNVARHRRVNADREEGDPGLTLARPERNRAALRRIR